MLDRLAETIASAGIPLKEVIPNAAQPTNPTLTFRPEATAQQQSDAAAIVASFDWTQATHDAWLRLKQHPAAQQLIDQLNEQGMILRALVAVLVDEINILRGQTIGIATATWDPASMANGSGVISPAVNVAGAAFGDVVEVAAPYDLAGVTATGYVSLAGQVRVRLENQTGGNANLASGEWKVVVRRYANTPDRTLTQARNAITSKLNSGEVDA